MSKRELEKVFILSTTETLAVQADDGGLIIEPWSPMLIHCWTLCYLNEYTDNPHYRNPDVLQAIKQLGDFNQTSLDQEKGFTNDTCGWDEWRLFSWMEATELLKEELNAECLAVWGKSFITAGDHVLSMCIDMETFDGGIPNHGIWNHAMLYRIGQLYNRNDMQDMAAHAFERIFQRQTEDGCFREGGTFAGFPGSPVTMYNIVSIMAINMYYGFSQDPAALDAMEKGWSWYYNFIFPDMSLPPALDARVHYVQGRSFIHPAYFSNKPEMRGVTEAFWKLRTGSERSKYLTGPSNCHGLGFLALQADKILDNVTPIEPSWPEYYKMTQGETCIRRRHNWHAVLCGISNAHAFTQTLPLWRLERQSLVNVFHEKLGLIIGSANSVVQEEISLFSFYEQGSAHYLHDNAYLKSTPPLDSLILQYRGNTGTVSVDTNQEKACTISLSIHGEMGKRTTPGPGHNISAVAAKARLSLRLKTGDKIIFKGKERILGEDGFILRIQPGEAVQCPGWTLSSSETPWTLRWPLYTNNPYAHLQPDEELAIAEAVLYSSATSTNAQPTVHFKIEIQ